MKKTLNRIVLALVLVLSAGQMVAQTKFPVINIKNVNGQTFSTADIDNDGKPVIISFWATWCKPCVRELNAIKDVYPDWQEETGVKIIAISIDDTRNSARVSPFVNGEGWEYEVLIDENSDLRRLLNVNNIPHTFLLNGNKEIVWQHNGYQQGDEEILYEEVLKLINGEPTSGH